MSAPFDWQAGRASREREVVYSLAALVAAGSGSGVDDGPPPGIGISRRSPSVSADDPLLVKVEASFQVPRAFWVTVTVSETCKC